MAVQLMPNFAGRVSPLGLGGGGSSSAAPAVEDSHIIHVNQAGDDADGDGSYASPFLTIGEAIDLITANADCDEAHPYAIMLGGGDYSESVTFPAHVYVHGIGAVTSILGVTQFSADGTSHIYNGFHNMRFAGNIFIPEATHRQFYFVNCGFINVLVRDTGVVTPSARFYNCYTHSTGQLKLVGSYEVYNFKGKLQVGDFAGGYTQQIDVNVFGSTLSELLIEEPASGANTTVVRLFGSKAAGLSLTGDDVSFSHDSASTFEGFTIVSGAPVITNLEMPAEVDVASAGTVNLGRTISGQVRITGTTTITSFGTAPAGTLRQGRFAGILTLTYNATSLILPGAASITTAAGDSFVAISLGSGNWLVRSYQRYGYAPPASFGSAAFTSSTDYARADGNGVLAQIYHLLSFDMVTSIAAGNGKYTFVMPYNFLAYEALLTVATAPTGADIIVDINITGEGSVFATRPVIQATEKSSRTGTTGIFNTGVFLENAEVTVDYDQVGSGEPGKGLQLVLIGNRFLL